MKFPDFDQADPAEALTLLLTSMTKEQRAIVRFMASKAAVEFLAWAKAERDKGTTPADLIKASMTGMSGLLAGIIFLSLKEGTAPEAAEDFGAVLKKVFVLHLAELISQTTKQPTQKGENK